MGFRQRSIPVSLGGLFFPSKTEAIKHVRSIKDRSVIGVALSGQDLSVIRELLTWHPDAEQKIGPGVDRIEVRINLEFGSSRGFWIARRDGTETDFSYKSCMDGDRSNRLYFIRCCRFAVKDHVEDVRQEFFRVAVNPTCPLLGIPVTLSNCHVDHAPPHTFERLVDAYCALYNLDPNCRSLCEHGLDGTIIPSFSSVILHDNWVHFHQSFARLRVVSQEANVRLVPKIAQASVLEKKPAQVVRT